MAAKRIQLIVDRPCPVTGSAVRVDLMIEKDAGNPIRILMGGKYSHENWTRLREVCDEALMTLDPEGLHDLPAIGDRSSL
jgi:hypothetical protein